MPKSFTIYLLVHPKPQTKVMSTLIPRWTSIIPQSTDVPDLGIIMSKDCSFDSLISSLSRKCKNLAGWILRSFVSRDKLTMLALFKSLVISRLDYASQLWSPHKISQITLIEKVQRSFTKHITGMRDLSYHERLQALRLYSLQRRRERYCIILIWKIIESKVDWRQCGNSLALCYFAVVMELPDSLWMNCKSEFGVIFLRCSPT